VKNKKIKSINCLFLLDAGPGIGMGHLRRCLVLAEKLKQKGVKNICFATKTPNDISVLVGAKFPIIHLPSTDSLKNRTDLLQSKIKDYRTKLIIVDSYKIAVNSLRAIEKRIAPVIVLDDYLHLSHYPVSGIINYNLGAEKRTYKCESETRLFLGAKYALISGEFIKEKKSARVQGIGRRLFVSLGANPAGSLLKKTLKAIGNIEENLKISLVLSPCYPNRDKYKSGKVSLVAPNAIARAMKRCDFALSAAGVTSYELVFMRIPTLLFVLARNQSRVAEEMQRCGAAKNLGWLKTISTSKLTVEISNFVNSKMKVAGKKVTKFNKIDGKGSDRLASFIISEYLRGKK